MTAEPITARNHAHDQADHHEILRLLAAAETRQRDMAASLAEVSALIDEFRPLLAAYRQTAGGTVGVFRARRALRNGAD